MSTFAVGDIHGNLSGLRDLLAQIRAELCPGDTVVFLGDYIDRGPDSKGCVDAILGFRDGAGADVVCLCGNHEDWMLSSRRDHTSHSWLLGMDPWVTIGSYSEDAERVLRDAVKASHGGVYGDGVPLPYEVFFEAMPDSHMEFFDRLKRYHQNEHGIFVHAGVDSRRPLADQTREAMTFGWGDGGFPAKYTGREIVVYGHRNNAELDKNGWPMPKRLGLTIGLDTSRHGVVTALRLPDERIFQSERYALM